MTRQRISVLIAQSVDGYIATDDDSLDWLTSSGAADEDYGFDAFIADVDVVAIGRSLTAVPVLLDTTTADRRPVVRQRHGATALRTRVNPKNAPAGAEATSRVLKFGVVAG